MCVSECACVRVCVNECVSARECVSDCECVDVGGDELIKNCD